MKSSQHFTVSEALVELYFDSNGSAMGSFLVPAVLHCFVDFFPHCFQLLVSHYYVHSFNTASLLEHNFRVSAYHHRSTSIKVEYIRCSQKYGFMISRTRVSQSVMKISTKSAFANSQYSGYHPAISQSMIAATRPSFMMILDGLKSPWAK